MNKGAEGGREEWERHGKNMWRRKHRQHNT